MFTSLFENLALVNVVQHVLLPHLLREHKQPQLRLWSVGCEIGDEAHVLVLLLAVVAMIARGERRPFPVLAAGTAVFAITWLATVAGN